MKRSFCWFTGLLVGVFSSLGPVSASTLTNASFESPILGINNFVYHPSGGGVGWNFNGNSGISAGGPWFDYFDNRAPNGTQAAFIQWTGTATNINQTLTGLNAGDFYQVTLDTAQRPGYAPLTLSVSADANSLGSLTPASEDWSQVNLPMFQAASDSAVLQFTANDMGDGDFDANIDNVSVLDCGSPANGVLNGSFEAQQLGDGNFRYNPTGCGWTFSGQSGIASMDGPWFGAAPPDGLQAAFLQFTGEALGIDNISQGLTGLIQGNSYQFTFSAASRPGFTEEAFTVSIDGTNIGDFDPSSSTFTQFTTSSFLATSSEMTLQFTADVNPDCVDCDSAIDHVQLVNLTSSSPEPSGAALVAAGIALWWVARRRRIGSAGR